MNDAWFTWIVICVVALLAVVVIAGGVALHSPHHYDALSVAVAVLWALGVELILTAVIALVAVA